MRKIAIILIFAFFLRLFGLDLLLIDDETVNPLLAMEFFKGNFNYSKIYSHPPTWLLNVTYYIKYLQFPFRALPLFYGLLTILTVYYFAEKLYDKATATLSAIIMSVGFYHVLGSLQFQVTGSLLTLLVTLICYFYYISIKNKRSRLLLLTGILFGIALLINYSSLLILPALSFFTLFSYRIKYVKQLFIFTFVAFLTFSIFPLTAFLIDKPELFLDTLRWAAKSSSLNERNLIFFFKSILKHFYQLLQYGTPLLVFIAFSSVLEKKYEQELLLFSWIGVFLFFFIFLVPTAPIARYQMLMIPPLSIITAREITKRRWKRSDKKILGVALLFFLGLLFTLNSFRLTQKPLTFTHFEWGLILQNADVWYTGFSGPLFKISSISLFFTVLLAALFFTIFLVSKEPSRQTALILLITVSFAFNVLLVEEFLFARFSPNYNEVMREMIDYYHENELPEPVYSKFEDLAYYVGAVNLEGGKLYNSASAPESLERMRTEGGTVMWLNLPPVFEGGPFWRTLENIKSTCELEKTVYSKGYDAGYIFICPSK